MWRVLIEHQNTLSHCMMLYDIGIAYHNSNVNDTIGVAIIDDYIIIVYSMLAYSII